MSFVHLHAHSEFSLLDGLSSPAAMARRAAELGHPALAITDHGNLHGAIKHYDACRAVGIRPIIGCEIYMGEPDDKDSWHLVLLAMDADGYRNLNELVSRASLENFYKKPRVTRAMLSAHSKGLICLSGCIGSEVPKKILSNMRDNGYASALFYRELFGDRYYLEVMDHGLPDEKRVNKALALLGPRLGARLVATADAHYARKEDAGTHELLLAIQTRTRWGDPKRWRFDGTGYWLLSTEEMQARAFAPEYMQASLEIADRCNLTLDLGVLPMPRPAGLPDGADEHEWLRTLVTDGIKDRYGDLQNMARAEYELDVIRRTGFVRYMLIVRDLCQWARTQGIRSSARGSAAGSLVAYALGITPVDPVRFGLSFERFLNEGRVPDIDLDFEDRRRAEVLAYAAQAYGSERVAQIVTFSEIGGRTALHDVGRVLGMQYDSERLAQAVPAGRTLRDMVLDDPLRSESDSELVQKALALEGTVRHIGKHAAGLVISAEPIIRHASLMRDANGGMPMLAVEMKDAERIGFVKFDMLGLKTLSMVSDTMRRIGKEVVPDEACPRTWALLGAGQTVGVFQLESPGMRRVLKDLGPSTIEHLQAVVALYRPGPMEQIGTYVARKNGREPVEYWHPAFEPVLKGTYGLIVYQEAIMEIAQKVAGMSPYDSDQFLGAVRKKNPEKLRIYEPRFRAGLLGAGVPERIVDQVWDDIVPFANYGFNQAHAACYAQLAYQTAWLKACWPLEYFASLLEMERDDTARVSTIVLDARRAGVRITGPCVNRSDAGFTVQDQSIRFGLAGIKYVGEGAVRELISRRPYESVEALLTGVNRRACSIRAIKHLVHAGATDQLANRRSALDIVGEPMGTAADRIRKERDVLGIAISGDILGTVDLDGMGRELMASDLGDVDQAQSVIMAGEVLGRKESRTRTGKTMVRLALRDESGEYEAVLFGPAAERDQSDLVPGAVVLLTGRPSTYRDEPGLVVTQCRRVA